MPDCSILSRKAPPCLILAASLLLSMFLSPSSMLVPAEGKSRSNSASQNEQPVGVMESSPRIDWNAPARGLSEDEKVRHLLNRISFGPGPDDLDAVRQKGIESYIEEQLNPEMIQQPEIIARGVGRTPALTESPARLFMRYGRPAFVAFAKTAKQGSGKLAGRSETASQGDGVLNGASRGMNGETSHRNHGELARGSRLLERASADGSKPSGELQAKKELQQMVRDSYRDLYSQVTDARLMRAVYSPRQLEEVMTDFWFNHFNISIDKGLDHLWVGSYEEQAIRPFVLGNFRDLLGATAHHAGMLFYLDNWQNTATKATPEAPQERFKNARFARMSDSERKEFLKRQVENGRITQQQMDNLLKLAGKPKRGKFSGLNENYARELMELHTLGVDGGYSQKDVIELARVLTGHGIVSERSIRKNPQEMDDRFGYFFDRGRHDFGEKVLLGNVIKGEGEAEVEKALDILCNHPSTARHISFKLAQYFVADEPPAALVDKMAQTFTSTRGDIKAVMRTLLTSNQFWDSRSYGAKFKTPYRYLVSSLRASGATLNNSQPLLGFLKLQGMPLYQCQTPDGYKNTETAWLNSSTLLQRINFATALGSGRLPAARANVGPDKLMQIAGVEQGSTTANVVDAAPRQLKLSLLIGSPEFMKH